MQINLPDDAVPNIAEKAAAAGFPGQVEAYLVHLIASDEPAGFGAPPDLSFTSKSKSEVDAMLTAGVESGPASEMSADDWRELHRRVDGRS